MWVSVLSQAHLIIEKEVFFCIYPNSKTVSSQKMLQSIYLPIINLSSNTCFFRVRHYLGLKARTGNIVYLEWILANGLINYAVADIKA